MHWELTMLCHFKVIADGHTHRQTHSLNTIVSQWLRGSTNKISILCLSSIYDNIIYRGQILSFHGYMPNICSWIEQILKNSPPPTESNGHSIIGNYKHMVDSILQIILILSVGSVNVMYFIIKLFYNVNIY